MVTEGLTNFNITSVLHYFIDSHSDYKDIRQSSFQMFEKGHIQDIEIMDDKLAKKTLLKATCIAQMKQTKYNIFLILLSTGDIDYAKCNCPAGAGPSGTCKHLAALCYALEDFVRRFIKEESRESQTERLSQWNKPRLVKLPPTPTHDINFEKKQYNKPSRPMCGKSPVFYQLDKVCRSERESALSFVSELRDIQESTNVPIGLLQVVDISNPIQTLHHNEPYIDVFVRECNVAIDNINKDVEANDQEKMERCVQAMTPNFESRNKIFQESIDQAASKQWHTIRSHCGRITGSTCHRIISFTGRGSSDKLVTSLFNPPCFSSAATKYGIDTEPLARGRYIDIKKELDPVISVTAAGFMIDQAKGYLGVSPDGVVICGDGTKGILEIKCPYKWMSAKPSQVVSQQDYPLCNVVTRTDANRLKFGFKLKESHIWHHQIQLALYCCREFAKFLDFVMYHGDSGYVHIERFKLDESWVAKNIPKLDQFFESYIVRRMISFT